MDAKNSSHASPPAICANRIAWLMHGYNMPNHPAYCNEACFEEDPPQQPEFLRNEGIRGAAQAVLDVLAAMNRDEAKSLPLVATNRDEAKRLPLVATNRDEAERLLIVPTDGDEANSLLPMTEQGMAVLDDVDTQSNLGRARWELRRAVCDYCVSHDSQCTTLTCNFYAVHNGRRRRLVDRVPCKEIRLGERQVIVIPLQSIESQGEKAMFPCRKTELTRCQWFLRSAKYWLDVYTDEISSLALDMYFGAETM